MSRLFSLITQGTVHTAPVPRKIHKTDHAQEKVFEDLEEKEILPGDAEDMQQSEEREPEVASLASSTRASSHLKIIPAQDFTTLLEANEILERAREDTDALRKQTEAECVDLKEGAKKEGFEEGLKQLNDQILGLDHEKKRLRHEMNKLVLPLALKAAKKIVAKELETAPETIVDIVLQAILPVTQNHHITIWVNKSDKEILDANKGALKEKLEQIESLAIRERDDVSPGGCIIETESGIINASIETQWRVIEAAFERYGKS